MPPPGPMVLALPASLVELLALPTTSLPGAACRGFAPLFDDWLDDENLEDRADRHRVARRVCRHCPAREPCAASVPSLPRSTGGVWGGRVLSEDRQTSARPMTDTPR